MAPIPFCTGAFPYHFSVLIILWVLANGLELASTDDTNTIFWHKFQAALVLPFVSAALGFALEYAGLGKWLTRRMRFLLAVMPLALCY